ncbi:MAG: gamma-glutamylcyclotransferase [Planctomycetota bacterium]|nr:MAG: gamma-glutamylcyclotransferase [Planctomycetota bacterium]
MAFELFVNGTLMRGLPLHANMGDAEFIGEFRTEPEYRLYSIDDIHPGMYRLEDGEAGGVAVTGELYRVNDNTWKQIEAGEPPNLYRGKVILENGREVFGVLYPRELAEGKHRDISAYGDWREYWNATHPQSLEQAR